MNHDNSRGPSLINQCTDKRINKISLSNEAPVHINEINKWGNATGKASYAENFKKEEHQSRGNMADVNINLQCECNHSRGVLYYANPLAWGRPCRQCRRMMSRNVVVVPTQVAVPAQAPVQTTTTTTTTSVPVRVTTY